VGSGGIEFADNSGAYSDRLYINDGTGNFQKSLQLFAAKPTAFLLTTDLDGDDDLDLIVGTRSIPFAYGIPASVQIWENDGNANFKDISQSHNPNLSALGMLTAGALADLDGDNNQEIILAGEWMAIRIFTIQDGKLIEKTAEFGFENTRGLWNTLLVEDINGDGKPDILAGNQGLNSRLRISYSSELRMILNDFDQNGALDHILAQYENQKTIPWVLKPALIRQIPVLRKQLLTYESYQNKSLEDLFPEAVWANSLTLQAEKLETSLWINEGQGKFQSTVLPFDVQSAPVYSITSIDSETGGRYLIFGGNQSRIKPELGSQMGSYGWVLKPDGKNQWKTLLPAESGLFVPGEIRDFLQINLENKPNLVVLRNNDTPLVFEIR
jgi:hypothetical protein